MIKKKITKFFDNKYLCWAVVSFIVFFALESVNQRSILDVFVFIFTQPVAFVVNMGIIAISFSIVLFVKRRLFCFSLITALWIIMGCINFVLLVQRNTQFTGSDVIIFRYGIFITAKYINLFHIILIAVAIISAGVGIFFLFKKGYRSRDNINAKKSGIILGAVAFATIFFMVSGYFAGLLTPRFSNITEGYRKNGYVYAFGCSMFVRGVKPSSEYSDELVQEIISSLPEENAKTDERPNVIFVQLESFIDPSEIEGLTTNADPVKNFNKLCSEYPSGHLTVPVLGGGTANTEFEVLTGLTIKHFGTVEYPYETFLGDSTCESIAYNYKALGYKSHAVHNFSAGFYTRNNVFKNLGFDTFTSFEYMSDIEYNEKGWAKDIILEDYIIEALDSTKERDFVYAISVQGHGSYPTEFDDGQSDITTTYTQGGSEKAKIDYYITQVQEMDYLVGNLVNTLSDYDEKTVVVFFGDHLPGIDFDPDSLKTDSLYKTEYVVWSNYDMQGEDRDITTYQLNSHVQSLIGLSSGNITKFHQTYSSHEKYEEYLHLLEYDIVEGKMITYGGENPYKPTDLVYGVASIEIHDTQLTNNTLTLKGQNFTEYSKVYVNGSPRDTAYVNSSTLKVNGIKLKKGDKIAVAQTDYHHHWTYLSISEEVEYNG